MRVSGEVIIYDDMRGDVPPSVSSMISQATRLPPVSRATSAPLCAIHWSRPSLAAFRISDARVASSFLLVLARMGSVSARVTICAGVKCRRVRGATR